MPEQESQFVSEDKADDRERKTVKIESAEDILDLAGKIRPRTKVSPLKAREVLEKSYRRR